MAKSSAPTTPKLTATVRERTGKGASRRARREGKVPAVLYGHGTEPRHLELDARHYSAVLRHSGANTVLTLDIDGTEELALTRALDVHPIKRTIQHADLLVVKRGEKVVVDVVVVVEGDSAPGTLVTQEVNTLEIEAEALSLPEQVTVSVEGAEAGTQFLAGQLDLGEGVSLISDPETLVVNVVAAPTAEELEAESGGASLDEQAAAAAEAGAEAAAAESE
ncbi:50S ribosomal protein L25/general stress protein Ctc [Mycolicibacterium thermoresistibile]|jgi:large subunit ribosomal protein L25|uniref:Large ribosomal subunit protein bL25 n=2 Tax=Mycolicibacterium thermoresistibile TaxID=1797 RepID=G7CCE9_MYCT3|nr:50S ribosomal protein L25/general stress protein Ctc [Mycolicibacterium thermoresistibile]EHI14412.1 50S ribosomal protein L25/general stress protein Ctc [Mycolicibacterium thermoresistibile ATCC 19527]MCV7189575.1 50S ribosomal protein L25/general stress protein Ctc [Mycolicibacterium thermoresistibile]GAT14566.1 50S ribosomal protein L25 [Mycolicibacterium thermoresistibile]SNW19794.1 50S ribosomal protein L25 [Mycolicibacterium thermoresistibile]